MFKIILVIIILLVLFPFWILAFFLVKNSVLPTWESGNLSDWMSTICNLVMALSAVYAAFKAKKWFKEKTLLNTLDSAHVFALKFDSLLWEINEEIFNDVLIRADLHFRSKKHRDSQKTAELLATLKLEEEKSASTQLSYYAKINNTKIRLERYNILTSEHLNRLFDEIMKARKEYLNEHNDYISDLTKVVLSGDQNPDSISMDKLNMKMNKLAALFENELVKIDINSDYTFKM